MAWFMGHADAVYALAFYRVGGDRELAADVVQETFLKALQRMEEYDPQRGPMTMWLGNITRNCIRTVRRRAGRDEVVGTAEHVDGQMLSALRNVGSSPLPEEILQRRETRELVAVTLSKLRCEYREVLIDRYYEQHPVKAIACSRGVTEGAVKSLLHRARQAFKNAFVNSAEVMVRDADSRGKAR